MNKFFIFSIVEEKLNNKWSKINLEKFYAECYDILVENAGARNTEDAKKDFVRSMLGYNIDAYVEYRFQGDLGFGGKFWRNDGRIYVSCYLEDENKERLQMLKKTNKLLADLQTKWLYV